MEIQQLNMILDHLYKCLGKKELELELVRMENAQLKAQLETLMNAGPKKQPKKKGKGK